MEYGDNQYPDKSQDKTPEIRPENNMNISNGHTESQEKSKKSSDSMYLEQLQYDPKEANSFIKFLLTNTRVVFLLIISLLAWGIFSFTMIPMESSPEVKIPYGVVSVTLPGAGPSDMEELVTKKIENKVVNISGVKQVTSTSGTSYSAVSVEFQADEDLKDAIRRLRDAVATVKSELPDDAGDPVVSEISFSNVPVWTIMLTGPYDNFTLRRYADEVEEGLLKLPGTSEVQISGGDTEEIRVSYNPQKMELYGLTMDQVNATIRSNNITLPLGELTVGNFEYSLRMDGKFKDINELRDLPIASFGESIIRLRDVATVVERAVDKKTLTRFSIEGRAPQNAIQISIVKKTGFSIIELIDQGKAKIEELKQTTLPESLEIETTYDESDIIREDFNNLSREAGNTIMLVTIILFLFVGLKEAFTAGLVIPLVFASTFGMMLIFGQTINFLSLFSLILTLGLLVDDAIVVVQASKQYMSTGRFTPEQAALLVFRDFFAILITTTLTTVFAFFPLVLATGIIGEFIQSIPITTTITLIASTIVAILVNLPMTAVLERFRINRMIFKIALIALIAIFIITLMGGLQGNVTSGIIAGVLLFAIITLLLWYRSSLKKQLLSNEEAMLRETAIPAEITRKLREHYSEDVSKSGWTKFTSGVVKLEKITPYYERMLNWFINKRIRAYILLTIILVAFAGSIFLPASGILRSEFLSASDYELMYVNIEGSPGMVVEETEKVADQVENILLQEQQIKNFSMVVGAAGIDMSGASTRGGGGSGGQSNRAQFAINLWPEKERPVKQKSYIFAQELRKKLADVKGAKVTLQEVSGGPPSGSDFEVRFTGEDLLKLEQVAEEYLGYLDEIPGTVNEKTSLTLNPGEFTFKLNTEAMQLRGITPGQIAGTLRSAVSGGEIAKIVEGEDEIRINAKYQDEYIDTLSALKSIKLTNMRGQTFQLAEIADIEIGSSLTSISRIDQKRVVVLSAAVEKPALPGEVLVEFQKILEEKPLPDGYTAVFGGQNDSNTESIFSILRAMIVAFILIIATMVIQFNSFRKAVLVLFTIPLAMTGVFYGLTIIGFTLSFPTLIGILALFGIVVKNAIILIDKINMNIKVGIPFQEAITDAAKSRMEAIFLTTTSTVIGMIPITFYDETWQGLGAALIFGLSTSTVFTLLLMPTMFFLLFEKTAAKEEKLKQIKAEYGSQNIGKDIGEGA